MIQHNIRALLVRTGLLVLICLALQIAGGPSALAQEPPPRPTLEPTPTPTITPTGTATPTPAPPKDNPPSPTEAPLGRIIGTVIDLTTNAPAPGITVAVGDVTVTTDANGNYERAGLPAGSYEVALILTAAQGTPAQGPVTIELAAGQTAVQHLAFRRQIAATATTTAAPTVAPSTPTAAPPKPTAAPPKPTSTPTVPATLPNTGDSAGHAASTSTGLLGTLILLLGLGIWGCTEWSRRRAVRQRSR